MAASAEVNTPKLGEGPDLDLVAVPMAVVKIWKGSLVAINLSGYGTPAATTAGYLVIGRAEETIDNTGGSAGDRTINVRRGVFRFANSATTGALTIADTGRRCFVVDDVTVSRLDAGSRPIAGRVVAVDSSGVWVKTGEVAEDTDDLLLVAGADLSTTGQFLFMKNSSGSVVLNDTAGGDCIGVLQNAPVQNAIAIVRTRGRSRVIASGTLNANTLIASDNAGKSKAAVTGRTDTSDAGAANDPLVGSFVLGRALTAGASATQHDVMLNCTPCGAVPQTAS